MSSKYNITEMFFIREAHWINVCKYVVNCVTVVSDKVQKSVVQGKSL